MRFGGIRVISRMSGKSFVSQGREAFYAPLCSVGTSIGVGRGGDCPDREVRECIWEVLLLSGGIYPLGFSCGGYGNITDGHWGRKSCMGRICEYYR